jgi:hypothetical protein
MSTASAKKSKQVVTSRKTKGDSAAMAAPTHNFDHGTSSMAVVHNLGLLIAIIRCLPITALIFLFAKPVLHCYLLAVNHEALCQFAKPVLASIVTGYGCLNVPE